MKTYVINNRRPKLPVLFTAVFYLLLDKFNAPGWVWGATGVIMFVIWALVLYALFACETLDIWQVLADREGITKDQFLKEIGEIKKHQKVSRFHKKLQELQEEHTKKMPRNENK